MKGSQSEVPTVHVTPVNEVTVKKGRGKYMRDTRKLSATKADHNSAPKEFKVQFPEKLSAFLQQQQKVLSLSSNGRLLLELPWQTKLPTVSMILDSFLNSHGHDVTSQLSTAKRKEHPSALSGTLPSYSMLKVY